MLLLLTVLGALPRGLVLGTGLVVALIATGAAWYFQIGTPLERFPGYAVYGAGCMATFVLLALFGGGHIKQDIGIGIAGFLVVLGILAERWNIVVPTLVGHPFMVPGPVGYFPTLTEIVLTFGVYAFGGLFFVFATMVLPLVESEEDEGPPRPPPEVTGDALIKGPRWEEIKGPRWEEIKGPRWEEIRGSGRKK
jgi:hypothetical protein